ncbi:YajQ family cyclic di-GMP-binding protein [Ferrimonas lipolytica]|uniref:Nucleotide-binding protein HER31_00955 n=1 Tax=Ferrimonas lipolytica TaxID=2724191 RepID=A0A6H1U974_9GAMM|nr:YajQ family cyclic di-GMP-binding protein [Ferrimonas lipolytica]QIZ75591.1 YajQ family cyclic di-GMP-binding protein [Ferrimonas lipolytica]
MPSFDIISEVDTVNVRNAVENANRELATRFDFRGVEASYEQKELVVTIKAEAEFQISQMETMLRGNLAKQQVDAKAMELAKKCEFSGKTASRQCTFKQGIEKDYAKKIVKQIKDAKLKVQASIQGDKVRVTGKKRDDLQGVMALLRSGEQDQPLQFDNMRD